MARELPMFDPPTGDGRIHQAEMPALANTAVSPRATTTAAAMSGSSPMTKS